MCYECIVFTLSENSSKRETENVENVRGQMCVDRCFVLLSLLLLSLLLLSLLLSLLLLSCLVLSCIVLSCLVSPHHVLSCLVLFCLVLFCFTSPFLVLSCPFLSFLVLSCLALSRLVVLFVLSCLVSPTLFCPALSYPMLFWLSLQSNV